MYEVKRKFTDVIKQKFMEIFNKKVRRDKKAQKIQTKATFMKDVYLMSYFANKMANKRINLFKLFYLIILADVYSLKKYGKPISSMNYLMYKNALNYPKLLAEHKYSKGIVYYEDGFIWSKKDFEYEDAFTQPDLNIIQYIWKIFGDCTPEVLRDIQAVYNKSFADVFKPLTEKDIEELKILGYDEYLLDCDAETLRRSSKAFKEWVLSKE